MKKTLTFLHTAMLYCCLALTGVCLGQTPGSIDPTFSSQANGPITSMAAQADGKIIVTGAFDGYANTARNSIARLNVDGSLDTTFDPPSDGGISDLLIQPDGKILIAGGFLTYDGISRNRIARLNSDGSLDTTFNPGTGANNGVTTLALQSDGKIIIGGLFTTYNGTTRNNIARLNSNGTLDTTFDPGAGTEEFIYSVVLQPDGKILVGGLFSSFDEADYSSIVRLNTNGSIDTTFDPGTGGLGILSIALQSDGKIVIGGFFTTFNEIERNYIARLNDNGSVDTNFDPGTGASHLIYCVSVLADGKILAGGQFNSFNGVEHEALASMNADGSIDTAFDFGVGPNGFVHSINQMTNGKIYIMGEFTFYNQEPEIPSSYITRINGTCNTPLPQGEGLQTVTNGATLENLQITGNQIKWYDVQGNPLPSNTQLTNGTTYNATQTIDGCESGYFAVTVEVILSTNTHDEIKLSCYPNPVNNKLNITSNNYINTVELYTIYGQKIMSQTLDSTEGSIEMSQLANAPYLVKIQSGNKMQSIVIVKQN